MKRIVFTHPAYERDRTVKVGWSWPTLFFGHWVPLFRGNLKWFAIMLCCQFAVGLVGMAVLPDSLGGLHLEPLDRAWVSQIPLGFWFAAIFNENHRVWLQSKGWTRKGELPPPSENGA